MLFAFHSAPSPRPVRSSFSARVARPLGIALGVAVDLVVGDPRRFHPVAGFGQVATALERRWYGDDVRHGAGFTAVAVGGPVLLGLALERATGRHPMLHTLTAAAATWAVVGGTSLAREGAVMSDLLESGDLPGARARLGHLCARDPDGMTGDDLARATVESLAENASDAVVGPLFWGAIAGVPGLLGYRAANTLDAMIGYPSERYLRFGRVAARLDDVLNLVPARLTGALVAACAPVAGGSARTAWRVLRRDGGAHPSPNAGRPEAATAGALGVRLGGANTYSGHLERRPELGDGRAPRVSDVRRAVRLGRSVALAGVATTVAMAAGLPALAAGLTKWIRGKRTHT